MEEAKFKRRHHRDRDDRERRLHDKSQKRQESSPDTEYTTHDHGPRYGQVVFPNGNLTNKIELSRSGSDIEVGTNYERS